MFDGTKKTQIQVTSGPKYKTEYTKNAEVKKTRPLIVSLCRLGNIHVMFFHKTASRNFENFSFVIFTCR